MLNHIDTEHVFDKGVQSGRGAFDTSRSEEFDDLVEKVREAVNKVEIEMPEPNGSFTEIS